LLVVSSQQEGIVGRLAHGRAGADQDHQGEDPRLQEQFHGLLLFEVSFFLTAFLSGSVSRTCTLGLFHDFFLGI
jgi:hypothetical protein